MQDIAILASVPNDFMRERLMTVADTSLSGARVARKLDVGMAHPGVR